MCMRTRLRLLLICFLLLEATGLTAQTAVKISGNVTASGKPVEATSLSLFKAKDSALVKVEVSY